MWAFYVTHMATEQDYYKILRVSKSATDKEIKSAYRKLALQWHPDRNKSPEAEKKFKEINRAYEVLSDPQKKQMYDQYGHDAFAAGAGRGASGQGPFGGGAYRQGPFTYTYYSDMGGGNPFDGTGFSDPFDIFEQFFGGGFGRAAGGRARPRHAYSLTIDFMEAMKGVTKEVHVPKGEAGGGSTVKTIKIPPGVSNGSRIRFDDFDIVVEVKPSDTFQRDGDDLVTDVDVSYTQAVLGDTVSVPTIDKPVTIKVQPGTQPGTLIRLGGKGAPRLRGGGRGDQYVRIKVTVPKTVNKRQKELLKELEDAS